MVDGLRLLAALMVVAYHYIAFGGGWAAPVQDVFPTAHLPAAYGWLGVELFFLISGFVICMSCWGRSLGEFFTSRVARLFPAYLFAVLATTAIVFLVPGGIGPKPVRDVLVNLTMLQQPLNAKDVDAVYWTLWAEIRFYLLFALVVWRGLTYRRAVMFCFLWAAAAMIMTKYDDSPLKQLLMPDICWYFIAGIAFFLMYRFRPTALLVGIVAGCFLAAQRFALIKQGRAERNIGYDVPDWPVLVLVVAFFLIMALVATGRLSWVRWRWLPVAGALTYPLYLLHEYIGWEVIRVLEGMVPPTLLLLGLVAAMLFIAWMVHRLIERPGMRWVRATLRSALAEVRQAPLAEEGRARFFLPRPLAGNEESRPTVNDPQRADWPTEVQLSKLDRPDPDAMSVGPR